MGVFAILVIAVWMIALLSLYLVKKGFRDVYYRELDQRLEMVESVLTSTAGESALRNATTDERPALSPYVLNVSALDVQSPRRAFDTVAQSGCLVAFENVAEMCAVLGNQAAVGAYLYIVGWFEGSSITPHRSGAPVSSAHRFAVETEVRGRMTRWVVVFQGSPRAGEIDVTRSDVDLYATGYRLGDENELTNNGRDEKELRGRLNYSPPGAGCATPACSKRWQFSFRVPLEAYREDSLRPDAQWPPADVRDLKISLRLLTPRIDNGIDEVLVDSLASTAKRKYSLESEIGPRFVALERVTIFEGNDRRSPVYETKAPPDGAPPFISKLTNKALALIPGRLATTTGGHVRRFTSSFGDYEIVVEPGEEIADAYMRPFAVQLVTMLVGTLVVIALAWALVEWRLVRRVRRLTHRSNAMSQSLRSDPDSIHSEFEELQGSDELGVLARGIHELLRRVNEEIRDRRSRLKRLQDLWSAIAHEIVSPLHSLAMLHPETTDDDASRPYVARMKAAVNSLINAGSLESATWNVTLAPLELDDFLRQLSVNALQHMQLTIAYHSGGSAVMVKADDAQLDQVLGHVLNNAKAFSPPDEAVRITLDLPDDKIARITVFNSGPKIPESILKTIFDLGVSERDDQLELFSRLHRGQGLFVARQLMTGMGGSIEAENVDPTGAQFVICLQRISSEVR